jgi:hypothetical protein
MSKSLQATRIHSQDSWLVQSDTVTCAVTRAGGHMAPVTFFANSAKPIQPYYVSPWQDESLKIDEPVLRPLRGDFFCLPFGANPTWKGENHRVHGEVAYKRWKKAGFSDEGGVKMLTLTMEPKVRPGTVSKRIALRDGENVVYVQHELSGFSGKTSMGHHATLIPPTKGKLHISTAPLLFGQTTPRAAAHTMDAEYYALAANKRFKQLSRVPTIWKDEPTTDCSVFPAREGFVDILSLYAKPSPTPAWTCAVAPEAGYLWFALKDPAILPATTLWMENRSRHGAPWSGRNCCIGLEDVCGYHAEGLKASAQRNDINAEGIPTCHTLSKRRPTRVNYIQGVVRIPRGFDKVKRLRFGQNAVTFTACSGKQVTASVNHDFIATGRA